jgi:hypothetical protein
MAKISTSIQIVVPLCACFTTIFTAYFVVTSLLLGLVAGAYIADVIVYEISRRK